ncbi:MAG: hypothetical protein PHP00_09390 [Thiotrichaceae bacterium]|nr:hypothetical protein [Thiotrichaceae bacterium]
MEPYQEALLKKAADTLASAATSAATSIDVENASRKLYEKIPQNRVGCLLRRVKYIFVSTIMCGLLGAFFKFGEVGAIVGFLLGFMVRDPDKTESVRVYRQKPVKKFGFFSLLWKIIKLFFVIMLCLVIFVVVLKAAK